MTAKVELPITERVLKGDLVRLVTAVSSCMDSSLCPGFSGLVRPCLWFGTSHSAFGQRLKILKIPFFSREPGC